MLLNCSVIGVMLSKGFIVCIFFVHINPTWWYYLILTHHSQQNNCVPLLYSQWWLNKSTVGFHVYLHQGGYVIVVVCMPVVCLLATLHKNNFWTDLHEIFREGWQWASEQIVKFWWRSGSRIWIQIRIATLVRRALAEVCTVPVLLVTNSTQLCSAESHIFSKSKRCA